jgi:iron uptake system component EfeO
MRPCHRPFVLALAGLATAGLTACSQPPAANSVAVTATDTDCQVATTTLKGGTTEFSVTNRGGKTTEFYVYDGGGRVKGEVEDIGPGVSRTLRVTLAAGTYEGACKPGQTGDGIRVKLTVSD